MALDLRGFAREKAELISSRLKELLSSGEGYVRTHFGVDLGLKAELYPPWVILLTAAVGLLLAVSCAALCGGLLSGKKRRSTVTTEGSTELDKALLTKTNTRSDDLKKKIKKKLSEKNQSNGQPVSLSQEENQANEKLSPKVKAEVHEVQAPAQVKKLKKKRPDAKPTQQASAADGKEADEGAWETKVSNREKRQQRKKERGPEDSGSPGGVDIPKTHVEGPGLKATKKNKGNHNCQPSRSSGKGDASGAAPCSWREDTSNNSAGWTDMSLKMSGQIGTVESPKWGTIPVSQPWTQEAQEPVANSVDLQWTNQDAADEWSGFNGIAAVDPTSDWNAPLEHWGNYEEPSVMVTPVFQIKEQPVINKLSEDEKDSEDPSEGAAKPKRKKRKKKKTEEEAVTQTMSSVPQSTVPKRQELPVQACHKSNISSVQKKPEETAEPPKPTQKKKVRRET